MSTGQLMMKARQLLQLTQGKFASQAGTSLRSVQRWEAGRAMPYVAELHRVAALITGTIPNWPHSWRRQGAPALVSLAWVPPPRRSRLRRRRPPSPWPWHPRLSPWCRLRANKPRSQPRLLRLPRPKARGSSRPAPTWRASSSALQRMPPPRRPTRCAQFPGGASGDGRGGAHRRRRAEGAESASCALPVPAGAVGALMGIAGGDVDLEALGTHVAKP